MLKTSLFFFAQKPASYQQHPGTISPYQHDKDDALDSRAKAGMLFEKHPITQ